MTQRIALVGQMPPPIHGLSKANDILYRAQGLKPDYDMIPLDIRDNRKILGVIKTLVGKGFDGYYVTLAQTPMGNIRDLILLALMVRKKKPLIYHIHGGHFGHMLKGLPGPLYGLNKKLLGQAACGIVLGPSLKYMLKDLMAADRIGTVENFSEDSCIQSREDGQRKKDHILEGRPLQFLYLSNMIESKGYEDVLEAMRICHETHGLDFKGVFAGGFNSESDRHIFEAKIATYGLGPKVSYIGLVSGEAKRKLLGASHVFILPTYYEKEGQPISIIEAKSNAMGIISTHHAGIDDTIGYEEALFVGPRSPEEIASAMMTYHKDRGLLQTHSKNNEDAYIQFFREEHFIKRMKDVFDQYYR